MVEADLQSGYFNYFWERNARDIQQIFGDVDLTGDQRAFYFIRNNSTAGVLVGHNVDGATLQVDLDYVTRPYRDLKIAQHFIAENRIARVMPDIAQLRVTAHRGFHADYLRQVGFQESAAEPGVFTKSLRAS
jgi:hypothetical protein